MYILYVSRDYDKEGLVKRSYHILRALLMFTEQDGFFEHSLFSTDIPVKKIKAAELRRNLKKTDKLHAVVINGKAGNFRDKESRANFFAENLDGLSVPKLLFTGGAKAETLSHDLLMNAVDIVFRREPLKNKNQYDTTEKNKIKIRPTMISCPFVHAPRDNWLSKAFHLVRPRVQPCKLGEEKYDVGFSGADAAEHSLRRDVWQRVIDERFSYIGGLQPNPNTKRSIPEQLQGPRFKGRAYRNALCQARINLALDGIGQYTFRHQELLYLGKFMLSSPTIRDLELPMPLEEGKHYVAFDDLDDMVEKIRYYLEHEDERNKIATAGKQLFDEYYDPVRHGQDIINALRQVQNEK